MKLLSPNSKAGWRCIPCISKSKKLFNSFAGNVLRNLTLLFLNNFVLFHFVIKVCLVLVEFAQGSWCLTILLTLSCELSIVDMCIFSGILFIYWTTAAKIIPPFFWLVSNCLAGESPLKNRLLSVKINPFDVDNSSYSSMMSVSLRNEYRSCWSVAEQRAIK